MCKNLWFDIESKKYDNWKTLLGKSLNGYTWGMQRWICSNLKSQLKKANAYFVFF